MQAAYLADYVFLILGLGLAAVALRRAMLRQASPGWLAAIALLPLAGPIAYLAWSTWELFVLQTREGGRVQPLGGGELARRAAEIEQERADGIRLPSRALELAQLRFKLGDDAEAAKLAREYLERFPGEAKPSHLLGRALLRLERYPEAVAALQDAVREDPKLDAGGAMMDLAKAFEEMDDPERARLAYDEVLKRYSLPEALYRAGRLAEKAEDFKEARKLYEKARDSARSATGSRRHIERQWEEAARRGLEGLKAKKK
jgi:tetratricopeptide (TPR) repeat protein